MCPDRDTQLLDKEWACLTLAIQRERQYLRKVTEHRILSARCRRKTSDARSVSLVVRVLDESARQFDQHKIERAMQLGLVVFLEIANVNRVFYEIVRGRSASTVDAPAMPGLQGDANQEAAIRGGR